jgi:hypothetical protein
MAIVYIKQSSNLECLTGVDQADPNAAKVWRNKIDGFVSRAAFTPEYLITSDDFFVSPGEHNMDVQLIWHGPTGYDGTTSSRSAPAPFESIDLTLNDALPLPRQNSRCVFRSRVGRFYCWNAGSNMVLSGQPWN